MLYQGGLYDFGLYDVPQQNLASLNVTGILASTAFLAVGQSSAMPRLAGLVNNARLGASGQANATSKAFGMVAAQRIGATGQGLVRLQTTGIIVKQSAVLAGFVTASTTTRQLSGSLAAVRSTLFASAQVNPKAMGIFFGSRPSLAAGQFLNSARAAGNAQSRRFVWTGNIVSILAARSLSGTLYFKPYTVVGNARAGSLAAGVLSARKTQFQGNATRYSSGFEDIQITVFIV